LTPNFAPPPQRIDTSASYFAVMATQRGDLVFELYPREVARLVNSFIFLSTSQFYDGTKFHRVIENYVLQGGDPTGTGEGGPGYMQPDQLSSRAHKVGTLSFANSGPDSNGSQFFVPLIDMPWLAGKYCAIGQLYSGEHVLRKIRQGDILHTVKIHEGKTSSPSLSWADVLAMWDKAINAANKITSIDEHTN
jgi:peptidyl-prolyl cis-trans isomerase B (cyclophilin B)